MKKTILFALFVLLTPSAFSQNYKSEYGYPVLALIETNPWMMVIGSDVPSFVLYKNGQILYKKTIAGKIKYFQTKVPSNKINETLQMLGVTDSLRILPSYIAGTRATDHPSSKLTLNLGHPKRIEVYGSLRYEKSEARQKTPSPFLKVFDKLINFKDSKAKEWLPDSIEVILTSYSYSAERPLNWPLGWPDLRDQHTVQRNTDLYSVYIDRKDLDKLTKFISSLKDKQAVRVNGRLFSVSYRFPFPNIR
ncbi:hypothetical protein [Mucilaginibacter rubeus]|uniref:Uncharacterized protein n=1 Tax=Mucilaginibacter rubeus TaxID=2027860 RepID=A0A5C1HY16_9SPHI|nr:hypothetical protein [Mucilaginibacter rubeus]QEM10837.1 hypothetical protein DEO27_012655 [Mucilaginibacter rubeus]